MRRNLLYVHRWTGLTVGLMAVFLALTGLTLVFRPQLEPVVRPELRVVSCETPVSLDTLIDTARVARPGMPVKEVEITGGAPTVVYFADDSEVHLDSCTGKVAVQQQDEWVGLFGTLEQLHRLRFLKPATGNLITGSTALAMALALVLGGLLIWWPATIDLMKRSLQLRTHLTGRAFELNLHRTVGVYACLIILLSCLTSLPLALLWVRHAGYVLTGSAPEPAKPASLGHGAGRPKTLGELWAVTQTLFPHPASARVSFPTTATDSAEVYVVEAGAPHADARSFLYLDAYTGAPLRVAPYAASSPGYKIYWWAMALHKGHVGGIFGQILLFVGILGVPMLGYTGVSTYVRSKIRTVTPAGVAHLTVQVTRKTPEAQGIYSFELADPKRKALPAFSAGSHIDVHVRQGITRQYSLCNDPKEKHRYLIGVLREAESRGGSAALHDQIEEGDLIEISQPKNHFPLTHSARHSLLFAGGIGITPILCMAERLGNIGANFEMHYSSKSLARTAFVERIRRSSFAERVQFHFSEGPPEQRLDAPRLLERRNADTHLYVCGPSRYMDFVIACAREKNWPEANIHREYFAGVVHSSENDTAFEVRIASTGKVYEIGRQQTVTRALAAHGIDIPTSCEQGVCGTCLTRLIEGEPEHRDVFLTSAERAMNDQFIPCCSRAKSQTLVLDL